MKSRIYFLAIAFFTIAAIGQLNIGNPFFTAGVLKPTAGGGGPSDFTTGLDLWLKADALSLNDGDLVETWTATIGNNASQPTSSLRPSFQTAEYNSLPTVRFDGVDNVMSVSVSADNICTYFVVAKRTLTANATLFALGAGSVAQVYNAAAGVWKYYQDDTAFGAGSAQAIGVAIVRYNGTTSADVKSQAGSTWVNLNPGGNHSSETTLFLGGATSVPTTPMDADICEVRRYDGALSDEDTNTVGNYLAWKWGFTWTNL